jgi:hypothetical protein
VNKVTDDPKAVEAVKAVKAVEAAKAEEQVEARKKAAQIKPNNGANFESRLDCIHFSKNFAKNNNFSRNSREILEKFEKKESKFKLVFFILLVV